jgi:hypothetical protein
MKPHRVSIELLINNKLEACSYGTSSSEGRWHYSIYYTVTVDVTNLIDKAIGSLDLTKCLLFLRFLLRRLPTLVSFSIVVSTPTISP